MEDKKPQPAFVADEDQAFWSLRPELRNGINQVEAEMRKNISEMMENLRPLMRVEMTEIEKPIVSGVPARFIRSMLPFFQAMSQMQDEAELLKRLHRRHVN